MSLALGSEDIPFACEFEMIERDGLVIKNRAFQDFIHTSFSVSDDQNENLVDELYKLYLKLNCRSYNARIFLQIVQ